MAWTTRLLSLPTRHKNGRKKITDDGEQSLPFSWRGPRASSVIAATAIVAADVPLTQEGADALTLYIPLDQE